MTIYLVSPEMCGTWHVTRYNTYDKTSCIAWEGVSTEAEAVARSIQVAKGHKPSRVVVIDGNGSERVEAAFG